MHRSEVIVGLEVEPELCGESEVASAVSVVIPTSPLMMRVTREK